MNIITKIFNINKYFIYYINKLEIMCIYIILPSAINILLNLAKCIMNYRLNADDVTLCLGILKQMGKLSIERLIEISKLNETEVKNVISVLKFKNIVHLTNESIYSWGSSIDEISLIPNSELLIQEVIFLINNNTDWNMKNHYNVFRYN